MRHLKRLAVSYLVSLAAVSGAFALWSRDVNRKYTAIAPYTPEIPR